jgi:hypothetical protein
MHKCINNSIGNVYHLEQFVSDFFPYSQKQLGFDKPVTIRFESDEKNSGVMLGKTAYYDPAGMEVVLYVDGRHPKDIMRSLSHELVHHAQNCRGDFSTNQETPEGYAQTDPHLRKMEREAYTKGNLIFRDYEDLIKTGKKQVDIDFTESGEPKMSLKEWKNNEINTKLMKKWGFLKEGAKPDFLDLDKDGDKEEPMKDAAKEIGSKEHNDEEGNRPSMAKDMDLKEDSEGEETYHYGEDEGEDDKELHDLIRRHATRSHIDALKRDMDYDEDHEDRREHGDHFRENADRWAKIVGDTSPVPPHDLDVSDETRLWWEEDPAGFAGFGTPGGGSEEDPHPVGALYSGDKKYDDEDVEYPKDVAAHEKRQRQAFAKQFKEGMFSPNHYCVHHGGVQHEGQVKMAEAINHNFDKKLNKVTWYDMKLQDGTILEQVAASDIFVTNASLAEGHHHAMRDEDEDDYKGIGSKEHDDEEGNRPSMAKKMDLGEHSRSGKISVREAKQITRRIIERIRKEGK